MSNKVTQPCSHLSDTCLQQGGPTLVTFERHLSSTRWPNLGRIWANPCLQRGGPSLVIFARNMSSTIVAQPWPHLTETCFQQYRTTLVTERNMSSASKMANLVNICAEPVFSQQGDPTLAIKAVEAFVLKVLGHQTRMLWGFCGGFVGALWGLCGGFCVEGAWPSKLWGLLC